MICQRCKKHKATVHLTDLLKQENAHLCDRCASEEGVIVKQHTPINELLTSFVMNQAGAQEAADLTCGECGISFAEFRNHGLLGCPEDYDTFDEFLVPLIARVQQDGDHHVGKVPASVGQSDKRQHQLMRLRRDLSHAVEGEDYEAAARLRDELTALESRS